MGLKVLTWNISYGYGMGSEGIAGYEPRPQSHFESALSSMSELIRNLNIDVVLLQEVDFHARRSAYIHELDYLARKSGLLYRNELISWDSPYVPYPGINPKRHFGRIVSGGGILSKYPIKPVQMDLLPKPREFSKIFNWFYLNRYLQMVDIESIRFCNLHLEAFAQENRELHLVKLQDRIRDYQIDIAGGDFNGQIHLSDEISKEWLAVPTPEPSFPCNDPKQYLDGFILKKSRFPEFKVKTLSSGIVSDHFPVLIELG